MLSGKQAFLSRRSCLEFLFVITVILILSKGVTVYALTSAEIARRAQLEAELSQVEQEIDQQTKLLNATEQQTASIERDISVLNYKIATAKLNIRAKQLEIDQLGSDISKKVDTIGTLNDKIDQEKVSLAELIRKTRDLDDTSVVEVALANNQLSDFFVDLNSFNYIQQSLHQSFNVIGQTKNQTEAEKGQLEDQRDTTMSAKKEIESETKKIQDMESQKQVLLASSKSQENSYKLILVDRKKRQTAILSALFALRDTKAIPFQTALQYAKIVSAKTGVRPAFILAILTQETNLGANVGTCNRPGDPPTKSWKNIMKPSRDYDPFLRITKALNIDPDTVPLSCPQGSGYGGAMGPSQFIPSTWELYEDRISAVTGHNPANPWDAEDAFAATGLYLEDLGAGGGNYTAEHRAAAKYYAGARWATAGNSYGDSVMAHADDIQTNIDYLESI